MILTYYIIATLLMLAYVLGSIPSAVWIGKKYYGIDIREHGSKNAGTTNMLRVLGKRAALPVFVLDFMKGFVAVTIVDLVKYDEFFAAAPNENGFYIMRFAALFCAVLGHIFPIFANFRGGKGVAASAGLLFVWDWRMALMCVGLFVLTVALSRMVSLGSVLAASYVPVLTFVFRRWADDMPMETVLFCTVLTSIVALCVIFKHGSNMRRIADGTERRIGEQVSIDESESSTEEK